ncbi:MAG: DUF3667 domain-containing protein [Leeuwenhoekiella sp.]
MKDLNKYQRSPRTKSLNYRGKKCLNCGTALDLSDRFCNYCGQVNSTQRLTVFNYLNEFIMSVITYDSRTYYTIKDLFTCPGKISRNYIAGKRIRYANPFRFFLSVSIIFFLLSSILDYLKTEENDSDIKIFDNSTEQGNTIDTLNYQISKEGAQDVDEIDKSFDTYEYIPSKDLDSLGIFARNGRKAWLFFEFYQKTSIKNASQALDSLNYKKTDFNMWLYRKNHLIDTIKEDPKSFGNYIKAKVPFYLFFFIPVLSLIYLLLYFKWYSYSTIKKRIAKSKRMQISFLNRKSNLGLIYLNALSLLFWPFTVKRKFNYMEHLVFNFHIHIFVFTGLLLCLLPDFFLKYNVFSAIFLCICPFYFYKAMRAFYLENRIVTLAKFIIINVVSLMLGGITGLFFFTAWAAIY